MAKVNKSDSKSILDTRFSAAKQGLNRLDASERRKKKAGLVTNLDRVMVKKDKSGKTTATKYGSKFSGPVSGSAVAKARAKKKDK